MTNIPMGAIDALFARTESDAALRERLLTDPKGTIEAETGMTLPVDWVIEARETAGAVEIGFENGELPDDYLELISGGVSNPVWGMYSCPR
jgi:hypothetical protein